MWHQILKFIFMEAAVLDRPNVRVKPNFISRTVTKTSRYLDAHFISLTKQVEAGLKPSISFEKVEDALASGSVSPEVIDDLEDAMFGRIMEERRSDESNESVSLEEVLEILRQR